MMNQENFKKNLTAQEVSEIFQRELTRLHRPAEELVFDDVELCRRLNVSRRTTASWRATGTIAYHKIGGIILYLYSDVLKMLSVNRKESIQSKLKF
jgi:hypothetical protein